MSDTATTFIEAPPEPTEAEQVEAWRRLQLERSGYTPKMAAELAGRSDVDLHEAMRLLERGCKRALAMRILAA